MDKIDELFDALCQHSDYKILKYKYLQTIIRIIYLSLKYRYCYQIGLNQKRDWIEEVNWCIIDYCYGFYGDTNHEDMSFFYEGEDLKEIYNDVVKLLIHQGYHDIPEDLYKEFTKDKICALNDENKCKKLLIDNWFRKYARNKSVKEELNYYK